MNIKQIPY